MWGFLNLSDSELFYKQVAPVSTGNGAVLAFSFIPTQILRRPTKSEIPQAIAHPEFVEGRANILRNTP